MVDYRKWDRIAASLDDDEEEEEAEEGNRFPMVTKFESPVGETIRIGKDGPSIVEKSGKESLPPFHEPPSEEVSKTIKTTSNLDDETLNGGICDGYHWGQNRQDVKVFITLRDGIQAKDITVSYSNRQLSITGPDEYVILKKKLRFDIELDDSGDMDWEIITKLMKLGEDSETFRRLLKLEMRKKSPIPGATFWWKGVFEGDAEIDVTKLSGRTPGRQSSEEVADAWKAAHDKFVQQASQREKIEIDC